jgi:phage gp36-like protein
MAFSARADIETRFGVDNVSQWADYDNDGNASTITANITAAIAYADAYIKGWMRGCRYAIALANAAGTVDPLIVDCSARLAGVFLYEHFGVPDSGRGPYHPYSYHRREARKTLLDIRQGNITLDAV